MFGQVVDCVGIGIGFPVAEPAVVVLVVRNDAQRVGCLRGQRLGDVAHADRAVGHFVPCREPCVFVGVECELLTKSSICAKTKDDM